MNPVIILDKGNRIRPLGPCVYFSCLRLDGLSVYGGQAYTGASDLVAFRFCSYNNPMRITFDPAKREKTIAERGLDFADAALVFAGVTLEVEDTRKHYDETRIICYGLLAGRMVVVGYTPRGADRHIFSMRKANEREQTRIAPRLEV